MLWCWLLEIAIALLKLRFPDLGCGDTDAIRLGIGISKFFQSAMSFSSFFTLPFFFLDFVKLCDRYFPG